MNKEEARQYIVNNARNYLQKDGQGTGFICPVCGSGSGPHGTGITTKDGIHFTCWAAGCFTNADMLDIIGIKYGVKEDYIAKLEAACKEFNIPLEKENPKDQSAAPGENRNIHNNITQESYTKQDTITDFSSFFLQAAQDIEKTDYHRGISLKTLKAYGVGYVEEWKHPKAPKMTPSPRLIIPVNKEAYIARHASTEDYINFRGEVENKKKACAKEGVSWTFNLQALKNARQPVFIVEGEIDALSIIDVGGDALAIGSASYVKKFLEDAKGYTPQQPLIVSLDNDKAGQKAAAELIEGLKNLKFAVYSFNVAGEYKDANERLNKDREGLASIVARLKEDPEEAIEALKLEADKAVLERESAYTYMFDFLKEIEASKTAEYSPTGFKELDALLDGGLYAGLYIVGAISSLGKTSFCLNIADNIAASGRDVLIFSLEMARKELIAKSVSRYTFIEAEKKGDSYHKTAKTTRGILTGSRYANYTPEERKVIEGAIGNYADHVSEHVYITEGIGDITIAKIRETIERYVRINKKAPICLIDYLQIIAPYDPHATDKQNTDKAVTELKRISRDYNIPILAISSFNRDNYNAPVNLASFKESGAIEYSSDVLIGLQYSGMDWRDKEKEPDRNRRIRELMASYIQAGKTGQSQDIEIKVLKNRNGSKGACVVKYWPMFNIFRDKVTDFEQEDTEEDFLI